MTAMPRTAPPKKKEPAAVLSSKSIAEHTEAFLKAGGKIEQIKSGISGHENLAAPKHLAPGNKPAV